MPRNSQPRRRAKRAIFYRKEMCGAQKRPYSIRRQIAPEILSPRISSRYHFRSKIPKLASSKIEAPVHDRHKTQTTMRPKRNQQSLQSAYSQSSNRKRTYRSLYRPNVALGPAWNLGRYFNKEPGSRCSKYILTASHNRSHRPFWNHRRLRNLLLAC